MALAVELHRCFQAIIIITSLIKKKNSVIGLNHYPILGTELCPPTHYPGASQVAQW